MGPNSSGIMPSKYVHVQSIFENIDGDMAVTFAADIIVFQNDVSLLSLCDQNIFYHQIFPRLMTRRARGEGAVLGAGGQRRLWLYVSTYKSLNEMKTLGECQKLIPWVGARGRGIVHTKVQCSVAAHAQWAGGCPVASLCVLRALLS